MERMDRFTDSVKLYIYFQNMVVINNKGKFLNIRKESFRYSSRIRFESSNLTLKKIKWSMISFQEML
jgi:hypothetical protein